MKRKSFVLRIVSLIIILCMLCMNVLPVSAIVISPDFAPLVNVLYSVTAEEAEESILSFLRTHNVNYSNDSIITVESDSDNNSSILHVTSQNGNTIEDTVLIGYVTDENDNITRSDFAKQLVFSTNDTGTGPILFANVMVTGTTVYDRTPNGSYIYVRPTAQKVACYDYGGTLPTAIRVNTQIQGKYCDTSFTVLNDTYAYDKTFYKSSPVFGTTYTQNGGMSTSRWMIPSGSVGYALRLQAVINGTTHSDFVTITSWW